MGLDMYLTKEVYVGAVYEHRNVTGSIDIKQDGKPISIEFDRIESITERAGYWRKANAIHAWLVANVQDGNDDCKEYEVEVEHMKKLLDLVNKVLADPALAPELLPSQSGFFFGSTEYDEWYFDDLRDTKEILERCIPQAEGKGWEVTFKYRSSW